MRKKPENRIPTKYETFCNILRVLVLALACFSCAKVCVITTDGNQHCVDVNQVVTDKDGKNG